MNDNKDKSAGSDENAGDNLIPPNIFLIMEGTKAIPLDKVLITFGRSHDNTIVVDDPRVSRHHVEIRVIRKQFVLFDLSSTGGTYVNGQRTSQIILYPGDLVSLAGVNFVFTLDTHLADRGTDPLSLAGPGERDTAIFNTSIFPKKKNKFWWK
ncbi:MAG: FHA domain-containing protein [Anaerolineales bacterium]|nr:FHA domain-containing protein [Anaerolineales bacterium]